MPDLDPIKKTTCVDKFSGPIELPDLGPITCIGKFSGPIESPDPLNAEACKVIPIICGFRTVNQCRFLKSYWEDHKYMKTCDFRNHPPNCRRIIYE